MTPAETLTAAADRIERVAQAATPGPWEVGDWWHIQSAALCECHRYGDLVWSGVRDINGRPMEAHVHRKTRPIGSDITQATALDGHPLDVTIGNDYGPALGAADAEHIASWSPDVALLLVPVLRDHADWIGHEPCCGPLCAGLACWTCLGTGHPHEPRDPDPLLLAFARAYLNGDANV